MATIRRPLSASQLGSPLATQTAFHERRLFFAGLISHFAMSLALVFVLQLNPSLSRDSVKYEIMGYQLANEFAQGNYSWSLWIDHGWYQLIGWVFYLVGPYILIVQFISALAMGAAAILIYRIGVYVFQSEVTARVSAYVAMLFPSALYFTALPIKEGCAIFAVSCCIWATCSFQQRRYPAGIFWTTIGLAITLSLRVYLVPIYLGCMALSLAPVRGRSVIQSVVVVGLWGLLLGAIVVTVGDHFGIRAKEYEHLKYFDIDYINSVRYDMSSGTGKMFDSKSDTSYGENVVDDVIKLLKGTLLFLLSIDVFSIRSARQAAAIPEMLFMLACIPNLLAGIKQGWLCFPRRILIILVFTFALIAVYGGTATNMGAMYRWRLQALPFLLLMVFYGASVRRKGILYPVLRKFMPRAAYSPRRSPTIPQAL